jgi:hypothetical protein
MGNRRILRPGADFLKSVPVWEFDESIHLTVHLEIMKNRSIPAMAVEDALVVFSGSFGNP